MSPFSRKSEEEKQAEREQRAAQESAAEAARQAQAEVTARHEASLPKWEYQVKRIGEDKQKGLLGSQRMEQIFNGEGAKGMGAHHDQRGAGDVQTATDVLTDRPGHRGAA